MKTEKKIKYLMWPCTSNFLPWQEEKFSKINIYDLLKKVKLKIEIKIL